MTGTSLNHQTWWRHATETPWGQRLIALSRIVSPSKLLATPTTPQPHSPPQRQLPAIFTYTHSPSHTTPFATQHTHTHARTHTKYTHTTHARALRCPPLPSACPPLLSAAHLLPRIGWSVETAAPQLLVEPWVVEVVGGESKGGAVFYDRITQHVEAERALVRSVDADLP